MTAICHPVTTKRLVIGQVSVCIGCCCGQTDRGKPAVPVEWLKTEWRRRGLLKNIQLTISGCLGPCDVPNVVLIATAEENIWLGNIDRFEYYREIVEWAAGAKPPAGCCRSPKICSGTDSTRFGRVPESTWSPDFMEARTGVHVESKSSSRKSFVSGPIICK